MADKTKGKNEEPFTPEEFRKMIRKAEKSKSYTIDEAKTRSEKWKLKYKLKHK